MPQDTWFKILSYQTQFKVYHADNPDVWCRDMDCEKDNKES